MIQRPSKFQPKFGPKPKPSTSPSNKGSSIPSPTFSQPNMSPATDFRPSPKPNMSPATDFKPSPIPKKEDKKKSSNRRSPPPSSSSPNMSPATDFKPTPVSSEAIKKVLERATSPTKTSPSRTSMNEALLRRQETIPSVARSERLKESYLETAKRGLSSPESFKQRLKEDILRPPFSPFKTRVFTSQPLSQRLRGEASRVEQRQRAEKNTGLRKEDTRIILKTAGANVLEFGEAISKPENIILGAGLLATRQGRKQASESLGRVGGFIEQNPKQAATDISASLLLNKIRIPDKINVPNLKQINTYLKKSDIFENLNIKGKGAKVRSGRSPPSKAQLRKQSFNIANNPNIKIDRSKGTIFQTKTGKQIGSSDIKRTTESIQFLKSGNDVTAKYNINTKFKSGYENVPVTIRDRTGKTTTRYVSVPKSKSISNKRVYNPQGPQSLSDIRKGGNFDYINVNTGGGQQQLVLVTKKGDYLRFKSEPKTTLKPNVVLFKNNKLNADNKPLITTSGEVQSSIVKNQPFIKLTSDKGFRPGMKEKLISRIKENQQKQLNIMNSKSNVVSKNKQDLSTKTKDILKNKDKYFSKEKNVMDVKSNVVSKNKQDLSTKTKVKISSSVLPKTSSMNLLSLTLASKTKNLSLNKLNSSNMVMNSLRVTSKSDLDNKIISRSRNDISNILDQEKIIDSVIMSDTILKSSSGEKVGRKNIPKILETPINTPNKIINNYFKKPNRPVKKKITFDPKKRKPLEEEEDFFKTKKVKGVKGFDVFIKEKGEQKKIASNVGLLLGKDILAKQLKKTLSSSGIFKETGKTTKNILSTGFFARTQPLFREYKVRKGEKIPISGLIEKRGTRLKTFEERKLIQKAKKVKGADLFGKSKSLNNSFTSKFKKRNKRK